MPCIEDLHLLIEWRLNITCDSGLFPVASGKLVKVKDAKDGKSKIFKFATEPFNYTKIGFCLGEFVAATTQDHPQVTYYALSKKAIDHIDNYLSPSKIVKEVSYFFYFIL